MILVMMVTIKKLTKASPAIIIKKLSIQKFNLSQRYEISVAQRWGFVK